LKFRDGIFDKRPEMFESHGLPREKIYRRRIGSPFTDSRSRAMTDVMNRDEGCDELTRINEIIRFNDAFQYVLFASSLCSAEGK
jgi:hypothetical protein